MTAGLTPDKRTREDVRYRLAVKRLYVRAAILDFLDSQPQPRCIYQIEDQPGITDFYLGSSLWRLGWSRIYEVGDNACVILFYPDPGATNKEAVEILRQNIMGFDSEDAEGGKALLYITANLGAGCQNYNDDICSSTDYPELGLARITLARAVLKKYRERIIARQKYEFQLVERAIIVLLRAHGFWPEEPSAAGQGASSPGLIPFGPQMGDSQHRLSGVKARRGRKPLARNDEEKVRIVQEWLKVQDTMTQIAFCVDKNISVPTLNRYKRYVITNKLLEDRDSLRS